MKVHNIDIMGKKYPNEKYNSEGYLVGWYLFDKQYENSSVMDKDDMEGTIVVNFDIGLIKPYPIYTTDDYDEVCRFVNEWLNKYKKELITKPKR